MKRYLYKTVFLEHVLILQVAKGVASTGNQQWEHWLQLHNGVLC